MSSEQKEIKIEDALADIEALKDGSIVLHKCGGQIMEVEIHLRKKAKNYPKVVDKVPA